MLNLPFNIVDVFAEEKYAGNQLAVFQDKKGISKNLMQRITKEMNFSETTFITNIDLKNYIFNIRIFTPEDELPFAGHPTLGTAYVIQQVIIREQIESITLNMKAGKIPVKFYYKDHKPDTLWMKQLNPQFGEIHPIKPIADILGLEPEEVDSNWPIQEVSTGVPFFIIPLKSRKSILRIKLDLDKLQSYTAITKAKWPLIFCNEPVDPTNQLKVRMITTFGEDPATGSANGCLAGYLAKYRYFEDPIVDIKVEQGLEIGRPSLLYLKAEDKGDIIDVYVGGKNIMIASGVFI